VLASSATRLGQSIIGGITDGINDGASHGGIGGGLKALTGSILIGFGNMMIEIGTQSLLAAQLLQESHRSVSELRP
jgi:hypothetical protein